MHQGIRQGSKASYEGCVLGSYNQSTSASRPR